LEYGKEEGPSKPADNGSLGLGLDTGASAGGSNAASGQEEKPLGGE